MITAYCQLDGEIKTTRAEVPKGALAIARCRDDVYSAFFGFITACSRHSVYQPKLLVPGMPEKESLNDKFKALRTFLKFMDAHKPKGVEVARIVVTTKFIGAEKNVAAIQRRKPRPAGMGKVRKRRA